VAFVVIGLLYSFFWSPVLHHVGLWAQPGDLWGTYQAAHFVGWGDIGDIYSATHAGFITFPGIAVLLAPVAMLTGALGLSESFPWIIPHATAWPVLAPVALAITVLPLFAFDAMAEFLGTGHRRRVLLCGAELLVLWPVIYWGHPEDAISMGLATYGLLALFKQQWRWGGWLFGGAVLFQPLALLLVPVALATLPGLRPCVRFLYRAALPAVVTLVIPLAQSWHGTTYALVEQPTYPSVNHPTPMLVLAPVIGSYKAKASDQVGAAGVGHSLRFVTAAPGTGGKVVAPGPGRIVALAIAAGLGWWAWRHKADPLRSVWLSGLVLAGWCAMEPVMTAYYLWPALGLVLVASAGLPWRRFGIVAGSSLFATLWSEWFFRPWVWWAPIMAALALGLICARGGVGRTRPPPADAAPRVSVGTVA